MKNKNQNFKPVLKILIHMYGGPNSLTAFRMVAIQEELQWYFPNITDSQLTYARNIMNNLKNKND